MHHLSRLFVVLAILLVAGTGQMAHARQPDAPVPTPARETVFVNVHTITLNDASVRRDQVVIVRHGRIVSMGSRSQIPVPVDAAVIDGRGGYLLPGLTDSHVHLDGDGTRVGTSRGEFGDGPLYLAHGVTSVVNLRGLPEHLRWRERVERGELLGPTIYTAGEFVNEPRVTTPEDVRRELEAQAAAGYDLIKFREVYSRETGYLTTEGLTRESYVAMNTVAAQLGIPLTGHSPANLGLQPVLDTGQALAHLGALSHIYFLPMLNHPVWLAVTGFAFLALTVIAVTSGLATIINRWRVLPPPPKAISRVRELAGLQLLAAAIAAASAILFLPGGPLFESATLRWVFTVMLVLVAAATTAIVYAMVTIWSEHDTSRAARVQAVVASIAGVALAWAAFAFWVPMIWRSSDRGIALLADQLREAGVSVQTTLVAYDALGGVGRRALMADPAIDYLHPEVQTRWRRLRGTAPRLRYTDFMQKLARILHERGVTLIAGTDAMGYPLVTPGSSLHRELDLLVGSGIPPLDALRAATLEPARFLKRPTEFGRIAPGMRADLLLVEGNPLDDITRLRAPVGVMARGHWYPRAELQRMLTGLASDSE
ncbi:MAG: amidohydrolase family protein [Acidobacteria bacterium]|nr:amidohydrolase family protein [Acidobacteriota bacterium]